jgi:hypothetical protein
MARGTKQAVVPLENCMMSEERLPRTRDVVPRYLLEAGQGRRARRMATDSWRRYWQSTLGRALPHPVKALLTSSKTQNETPTHELRYRSGPCLLLPLQHVDPLTPPPLAIPPGVRPCP